MIRVIRSVVNRLRRTRDAEPGEEERLAALPRAACDASALGLFTREWLHETFSDPTITAGWDEDERRLAALNLPDMTGGVNSGDRRALYYLLRRLRPAAVLEIGTHIGSSTSALALAAARNRAEGVLTEITTADIKDVNDPVARPWEQYESPHAPRAALAALGCNGFVRFEVASSVEALARAGRRFGLVFLDGSHNSDMVYREIPLALARLETGGLIVLHDFFPGRKALWPGAPPIVGPALATERLIAERANFIPVPLGDLPWATKLGSTTTSLAVLSRGTGPHPQATAE